MSSGSDQEETNSDSLIIYFSPDNITVFKIKMWTPAAMSISERQHVEVIVRKTNLRLQREAAAVICFYSSRLQSQRKAASVPLKTETEGIFRV